jgi:hypothetical protein
MATFEFKGFDEIENKLKKWKQRAEELSYEKIPFSDLFNALFMGKYTNFSSFNQFLNAGGFAAETDEEFKAIPDDEFDLHISKTTKFDCWGDMQSKAAEIYAIKKLNS